MLSGFDFSSYDTLDAATLQAQALTSGIYFAYLRASHRADTGCIIRKRPVRLRQASWF